MLHALCSLARAPGTPPYTLTPPMKRLSWCVGVDDPLPLALPPARPDASGAGRAPSRSGWV
jgi:hypothetical protein